MPGKSATLALVRSPSSFRLAQSPHLKEKISVPHCAPRFPLFDTPKISNLKLKWRRICSLRLARQLEILPFDQTFTFYDTLYFTTFTVGASSRFTARVAHAATVF